MVGRLAWHGLLEFRLSRSPNGVDQVVIEPQVADYWPRTAPLSSVDVLVLSRFAYMRRRGNEMVLELPRSGALFKICDPKLAATIALLSTPQKIKQIGGRTLVMDLLALLVDCQILFKVNAGGSGLRPDEGDDNLVLWDFHDLLFHARSTQGRHANPAGRMFPYADVVSPLPAMRPRWPGKKIDLLKLSVAAPPTITPLAKLLRQRRSARSFDDRRPITISELARFLDGSARAASKFRTRLELAGARSPSITSAPRPYPSAGGGYELELYLAIGQCQGLGRGFYHYDAGAHALVRIGVPANELDALLTGAKYAMGAPAAPPIVITIAARFGRISWKYSSIAYALILKDAGVLMQTFYLMATDMGLGGCAIGTADIDLFAKMTGIEFHVEGPVGQFALGRASRTKAAG